MRIPGRARRWPGAVLLACGCVWAPCAPSADGETDPTASALAVDGSARAGWWSGSRSLDDESNIGTGSLWARGKLDLGAGGSVSADAWAGGRSKESSQDDRRGRVRELYWQQSAGDLDFRLGRQMIVWGRADAINPTDNLTPRDFTLLTPEDSDERFGNLAFNVQYHLGEYSVQAVLMPQFQTDIIPLRSTPLVDFIRRVPPQRNQWALKLDRTGGSLDWSVSYFDGYDTIPDLGLTGIGPTGVELTLTNHRLQAWGADASYGVGPYVIRGETAWLRAEQAGTDPFASKRSRAWLVVGAERGFGGRSTVGLQLFAQRVFDYQSPDEIANPIAQQVAWLQAAIANQVAPYQHGLSFRVARPWAGDAWHAEISGVYVFTDGSYVWRGRVNHAFDDHWRLVLGLDSYGGPTHSQLGMLKDNSAAFLELRYVF